MRPVVETPRTKVAVLFPGQGAQHPGMGLDLARAYPFTAGRVMRTADRVAGFRLTSLIENASPRVLARTDITQPALVAASLAAWRALVTELPGFVPAFAAGLSLGEYTALAAAGVLDDEDVLRLVTWRGRYMEEAARDHRGGMCAVLGLERGVVESLCRESTSSGAGRVWVANYNAPGQCVISGEQGALKVAAGLSASQGGRVVPLKVSGPFHSPLMGRAGRRLAALLATASVRTPRFPVYSNAAGRPYTGPESLVRGLERQVSSPVLWEDIVRDMDLQGVELFVEVGPGRTLASLVRRILPGAEVMGVSDLESLARAVELLRPDAAGEGAAR